MFFPIQENFSGGEISPRMYGRTDSPQYKKGVAFSENWLHLAQGPMRLRGGTAYLTPAYVNAPFRVIPFNLQEGQDYCAELGWSNGSGGYIRVLNTNGPLPAEGPETVVNGSFTTGISPGWTAGGLGCFYSPSAAMQLCVVTTWEDIEPDPSIHQPGHIRPPPAVPVMSQTIPTATAPAGTYNFTFGFSDETGLGARIRVFDIQTSSNVYVQNNPGYYVNAAVTIGNAGCTIFFESTAPAGTKGLQITFRGPISFRNQAGTPALITGLPWTADMLRGIQYAQDVKEGLFLVHPLMTPMQVKYDNVTNVFTCAPVAFLAPSVSAVTHVGTGASAMTVTGTPTQSVNAIITVTKGGANLAATPQVSISLDGGATFLTQLSQGFINTAGAMALQNTGLTLHWSNASFVEGDVYLFTASGPQPSDWTTGNYPACVEVWQSRLWFANTSTLPSTLWASRTFNYYDFTVDAIISEASPFTLTSNTKGAIKWIRGKQSFLVGTDLHEDTIASSTQVVSALDAQLLRQSAYGSGEVQAIDVGDQVLFISRDYSKVRSLNFNFDTQAWLSHDITWFAQHITNPGIVSIAFARDPDNTIYLVLSDGSMRMCTYDRLAEVVAWSRMTTQGFVNDCMVTVDPTGATTWLAVLRNNVWQIEVVSAYNPATAQWMDCWQQVIPVVTTLPGPTYTLTVSGLQNLDGLQCLVLVDGAYLGFATPAGGAFTIPYGNATATVATVGLAYPATPVTLLPLNEGVMYGTAQGQFKRRHRIFVRLLTSILPRINGIRPRPQRAPSTPMGVVQPPIPFNDIFVTQLGWDRFAQVTIDQEIPTQTEIAAIFGGSDVTEAM